MRTKNIVVSLCLLAMTGCGAIAANISTQKRRLQAVEIPSLTGGRAASAADYPAPTKLPTLDFARSDWKDSQQTYALCGVGLPNDTGGVLKQVQDVIGRTGLYKDASATKVVPLPFAAKSVESLTLECKGDKLLLGVNGEAISPSYVVGLVLGSPDSPGLTLQFLGLDTKSADFLWVHLAIDKGSWKLTGSSVAAGNVKPYLPENFTGVRHLVRAIASSQAEFAFLDGPESGFYLNLEDRKARVARFKVTGE